MSFDATNWAIKQRGLKPAAKIVLWHLCDRYHPDHGCFPSQDTLADDCELPRSTLNVHLNDLEAAGLIAREQRRSKGTRRQESTRYRFPFEPGFERQNALKPGPETGHGSDEAVSRNQPEPCPENGKSRVQNLDSNPVREPVREPVNERGRARDGSKEDLKDLEKRHDALRIGKHGNPWPAVLKQSKDWSFRQFLALTPEEREMAEERRDAYLALCPRIKNGERKGEPDAVVLGVYLRDKLFNDLQAIAPNAVRRAQAAEPVKVAPFGPLWAGLRMLPLLRSPTSVDLPENLRETIRTTFDAHRRSSESRALAYLERKGIALAGNDLVFPDDFEEAEGKRRALDIGYPEANRLNRLAADRQSEEADAWAAVFSEICEPVEVGSDMWRHWKAWHETNSKPFVPDPGTMKVVWFPKGGPSGLDAFKAAALAARVERGDEHAA
jgi:hypothetical protein